MHLKLSALLRLFSCAEHIKVDVFDQLVKETLLLLTQKFPWVRLNFTLHQIQHAWQLICENEDSDPYLNVYPVGLLITLTDPAKKTKILSLIPIIVWSSQFSCNLMNVNKCGFSHIVFLYLCMKF